MAENKKHVYDESKIKTLSSLEHIRLRTGMYIGRIGDGSHYDDGCYILLKEVIDNGIDEFIMGFGKEVKIDIQDKAVTIRDFGRVFGNPWKDRFFMLFGRKYYLDGIEHESERLRIPHRDLLTRRFVLAPLVELDPDLALPDGSRLADALAGLEGQRVERVGSL